MADQLIDTQGPPATPASGQVVLYFDSVTKQLTFKNDTGRYHTAPGVKNWNVADVVANAADTYLTGSGLAIPPHLMQAGSVFKWRVFMTKTGAGIAAPIWTVRVGAAGSVADAARLTFTGPAQTAVIDTGFVEITAILRNVGAAGVLAGGLILNHNLAATGFANIGSPTLQVVSAGFDTTAAGLIVGISVNPGSAGVWTHQVIKAEALNV